MWPAHAAYIYDQGYADVDRYSRYLQRVEQPGPFYSSFLDWEYARGHVGPTPSPAGSPYLGGFGHKASPHGAHGPPGWAAPDPRPWEYNHPGEPPRNAQLLRDEPARDVQIHETFLHMMKARNQRKYGKLWSTWHPLHFWRLLFLVFFFFFAIFGSMSFTTTKGDAGSHWQQISQIDWQWVCRAVPCRVVFSCGVLWCAVLGFHKLLRCAVLWSGTVCCDVGSPFLVEFRLRVNKKR